ncbi:hypothetical protein HDV00_006288 [Rhizophlyctis rosea]|nr:hypothetical protein HDV00_006288 [Rhizophlyctis rosea]
MPSSKLAALGLLLLTCSNTLAIAVDRTAQQPFLEIQPIKPDSGFSLADPPTHADELTIVPRPRKPKQPRACATAPKLPGDRRGRRGELTLMNFNAEWLFLNGGSGQMRCPGTGCPWKTDRMAEQHLARVAITIASLNFPDIVHLTEIEGCDVLETLISILEKFGSTPGEYKPYLIPGRDTATGQQVGFITKVDPVQNLVRTDERVRYPIEGSSCNWSDPDEPKWLYGSTKNYFARFVVDGVGIMLSGNHFLAFPDKRDRCEKREAQALSIARAVESHLHTYSSDEVIVLGDLNDFDEEVVDAAGELDHPISKALYTLRHCTTPPLFNLAHSWKAPEERYTNWFDRNHNCIDDGTIEHTLIDHVLVSQGLRGRIVESFASHNHTEYCGKIDSDHWPIFVRFNMTA